MKIVFTKEQVQEIVLQHVKDVYDDDMKYVQMKEYSGDFIEISDERFKKD
jgi:hypothetical protein